MVLTTRRDCSLLDGVERRGREGAVPAGGVIALDGGLALRGFVVVVWTGDAGTLTD